MRDNAHLLTLTILRRNHGGRSALIGRATRCVFLTVAAWFATLLLSSGLIVASACATTAQPAGGFQTTAKYAILVDSTSNAVLFEHNADEPAPPASMSKLMTLAVVYRAISLGQLKLDDEFLVSEYAWRTGGAPSRTSAMMVPVNTRETLEQLIRGIVVQSGNDAAIAIAEGLAGSEEAFAKVMQAEAKRLGLRNSTFRNSTGLPHPEHRMSARDLVILAEHLIEDYPELYKLFAEREFRYRRHVFRNRNPLLDLDIGVDGLKTGFTSEAGHGVVASAVQGDRRLVVVVNGLETGNERRREAQRLLEWGFRGFSKFDLFASGDIVGQARVWGGTQFFVPLTGNGPLTVVLPRFPVNQRLTAEIVYEGPLKPPIASGAEVAKLRVRSSTGAVNEIPLYAAEDVATAGVLRRGLDSAFHLAFGWLP
ncbi:MAG: D-alanyl-D-alanine carboxypeptidase family protein [Hyphomicrobiaceae bacterium]